MSLPSFYDLCRYGITAWERAHGIWDVYDIEFVLDLLLHRELVVIVIQQLDVILVEHNIRWRCSLLSLVVI